MKSIPRRSALALLAVTALLASAAPAGAEYLIPPENSAATQYTEAIPTSGGRQDAERDDARRDRDPGEVLGSRNARQLSAEGSAGQDLAEFTAETAPTIVAGARSGSAGGGGDPASRAASGRSAGGIGGSASDRGGSGSSAFREVVEQATGSSSGELGLLLPLLILAALAWGGWYALSRRDGHSGPRPSRS